MKKINIFYESIDKASKFIVEKEKTENKELNSNDIFDKLKDKVDKEVFTKLFDKYYNKLSEKNKEFFKQINQNKFFEWKQTGEFVLATILFLSKNWEKKNKKIKIFLRKKPVLVLRMIKKMENEAKTILKEEKKEQESIKKGKQVDNNIKQVDNNIKQVDNNIKNNFEQYKEAISKLAKKFSWKLEKTNPQLNQQIKENASELKKKYPKISEDEAYLLYVSKERKTNPDFPKINLWEQEQAILSQVESKYWYLLIEDKTVWSDKIQSEIGDFANTETDYDEKISSSLDTKEFELHLIYHRQFIFNHRQWYPIKGYFFDKKHKKSIINLKNKVNLLKVK